MSRPGACFHDCICLISSGGPVFFESTIELPGRAGRAPEQGLQSGGDSSWAEGLSKEKEKDSTLSGRKELEPTRETRPKIKRQRHHDKPLSSEAPFRNSL